VFKSYTCWWCQSTACLQTRDIASSSPRQVCASRQDLAQQGVRVNGVSDDHDAAIAPLSENTTLQQPGYLVGNSDEAVLAIAIGGKRRCGLKWHAGKLSRAAADLC
jgi:hypothetical protein